MIVIGFMLLAIFIVSVVYILSLLGILGWILLVLILTACLLIWIDIKIIKKLLRKIVKIFK